MNPNQLKQLEKLAKVFNTDNVITPEDIAQVVEGIARIIKVERENIKGISEEHKQTLQSVIETVSNEHDKILKEVKNTSETAKSEATEAITKAISEMKRMCAEVMEMKPKDGEKGEDADEEKIIEEVLAKIKLPEYDAFSLEEKGEDIVYEINSLPTDEDEYKIDASHIKNLPTPIIRGGNISKSVYQLEDVNLTNLANNDVLKYDSTLKQWKNGTGGGGGAVDSVNGQTGVVVLDAGDISVDDSSFETLAGTNVQDVLDDADELLLDARSTGIHFGGEVTQNGATTVDVEAGEGAILDNTIPATPTYSHVIWSAVTGLSVSSGLNYIYVTSTGTVSVTSTAPSHEDYRLYIWLARVSVTGGTITGINAIPMPIQQTAAGIWDIFRAYGLVKRDLVVSAASTNLTIQVGAGEIYQAGINFFNDATNPHEASFTLQSPQTFRMATSSAVVATNVTNLDVGNYDVAGVVTAIPSTPTRYQIFTVYKFPQGNVRILYGKTLYTSITNALTGLSTYSPTPPTGFDQAIILAYIIARNTATNLSDSTQANFTLTNKFGGTGGALSANFSGFLQATNNLSDVSSVSTSRTNLGIGTGDSPTFTGTTLSGLTADTILSANGSKAITSLSTATYPSLTELARIKGLTSAVQTQLDAKVDDGAVTTSGLTMATSRILGRTTASTGAIEELTAGSSLSLSAGSLDTIQDIRTSASPEFTGVNVGHATDTTITRSAAGVIAVEGVVIPSISSTNTLTNKRITKRVGTTTSSATPTINTDNVDYYSLTAQTADITSFTTNLSGTPTDAQTLWISITGTAARAITWGSSFESSTVTLPTTTVSTNRLDVGFVWNSTSSKWRCIASA